MQNERLKLLKIFDNKLQLIQVHRFPTTHEKLAPLYSFIQDVDRNL